MLLSTALLIGSAISAGANLINSYLDRKANQEQYNKDMERLNKQEAEAKANAEKTQTEQQEKQKKTKELYQGMQTNLYSSNVNGMSSNALLGNTSGSTNMYLQ